MANLSPQQQTPTLRPRQMKRIAADLMVLREMEKDFGYVCHINDEDYSVFSITVPGPENSLYEGGRFRIQIELVEWYPFGPPGVRFLTPVYHPNISKEGYVCYELLRAKPEGSYAPNVTMAAIIMSMQHLLACPNPDDPLRRDAAEMMKGAPLVYERYVREMVRKYSEPDERLQALPPKRDDATTADVPDGAANRSELSMASGEEIANIVQNLVGGQGDNYLASRASIDEIGAANLIGHAGEVGNRAESLIGRNGPNMIGAHIENLMVLRENIDNGDENPLVAFADVAVGSGGQNGDQSGNGGANSTANVEANSMGNGVGNGNRQDNALCTPAAENVAESAKQ